MSDSTQQTPEGGVPLAGDNPGYLADPIQDALVNMVMELAAQVWVNRERMSALETVLEERGDLPADAVESYRPSPQRAVQLRAERDQFVADILKEIQRLAPQGN
jgi:hypothetical protein